MAPAGLKHMKAVITVAEELSFSRAAKRLHISQPAVTKYVAEVEESLGVLLFVRDRHVVSLTDACRAYVEEARIAVLHAERAVQSSRAADRDAEFSVHIGRSLFADPFFTAMFVALRLPLFPKLRLNLSTGFSCDLIHDVLSGELDIAVVTEPSLSDLLTGLRIDESPLYVVMSQHHELASHPSLSLQQLDKRRWITFQRQIHPPLYDLVQRQAEKMKVIPSEIQHFMVPDESIPLLSDTDSVVIAERSGALRIARDGLTLRPLEDPVLMTHTLLVSRADNGSKVLSELVRGFMRRIDHRIVDEQMSLLLKPQSL